MFQRPRRRRPSCITPRRRKADVLLGVLSGVTVSHESSGMPRAGARCSGHHERDTGTDVLNELMALYSLQRAMYNLSRPSARQSIRGYIAQATTPQRQSPTATEGPPPCRCASSAATAAGRSPAGRLSRLDAQGRGAARSQAESGGDDGLQLREERSAPDSRRIRRGLHPPGGALLHLPLKRRKAAFALSSSRRLPSP